MDETTLRKVLGPKAGSGLGARIAERAEAEGLLDVAYAVEDSPLGPLLLAATEQGLVRVTFSTYDFDATLAELAERISPRVLEAPARLDPVRRELDEYFEGDRREFDLQIDWRLSSGFRLEARRALMGVGYGQTASYGELAEMAGRPRAARAVGTAMAQNPIALIVPCHRVVRSDGSVGEYGGGPEMKEFLLRHEGSLR